jgi:hypothetical protein
MEIALRLEYMKEDALNGISIILIDIDKMLTGLIKSLKK